MKKILAIALAMVLVLSCFALADTANNATFVVNSGVTCTLDSDSNSNVKEGKVCTEVWLQVEAAGQIDVEVPLVLVFKTNIDGGVATIDSAYKMINHSTADLAVTKIATATEANAEPGVTNPMTLKSYTVDMAEDQYGVKINFTGYSGVAAKGTHDVPDYEFDFAQVTDTKSATEGGLFTLKKAAAGEEATGTPTTLKASMKTGKLSFVTKVIEGTEELDTTKGVKLITITYTVAINKKDAIGTEITTTSHKNEHN